MSNIRYRRRFFTEAEIERAKTMRLQGTSWRDLGVTLDCDYATIRRAIEPRYHEIRAKQARATRRPEKSLGPREPVTSRRPIPQEVIADRDRRSNAPRSLTALFCGDPAPGQSALDKQRSA